MVEERLAKIAEQLQTVVADVAPQAWEASLAAIRWQGAFSVGASLLGLIFVAVALSLAWRHRAWFEGGKYGPDFPEVMVMIFGGLFVFGIALASTIALLCWQTWAAIFAPELVIVARVIGG